MLQSDYDKLSKLRNNAIIGIGNPILRAKIEYWYSDTVKYSATVYTRLFCIDSANRYTFCVTFNDLIWRIMPGMSTVAGEGPIYYMFKVSQ